KPGQVRNSRIGILEYKYPLSSWIACCTISLFLKPSLHLQGRFFSDFVLFFPVCHSPCGYTPAIGDCCQPDEIATPKGLAETYIYYGFGKYLNLNGKRRNILCAVSFILPQSLAKLAQRGAEKYGK